MTETNVEITPSIVDTVKSYIFSKRMVYLVTALVLCIGIYYYMNRKSEGKNVAEENLNIPNQQPEIVFSQELVENIYRNNSNPIQYLIQLQQEGQIPKGPLPKIVIDNSIINPQYNLNQISQEDATQAVNKVQLKENENEIQPTQISYDKHLTKIENNDNSANQYQRIEEDEDDSIIDHQLTKEEIEKISNSVLSKN
tara:strand:+ start:669 stop:1259 length:591 start_codon:yes stop_codon:yes gene_type:complete